MESLCSIPRYLKTPESASQECSRDITKSDAPRNLVTVIRDIDDQDDDERPIACARLSPTSLLFSGISSKVASPILLLRCHTQAARGPIQYRRKPCGHVRVHSNVFDHLILTCNRCYTSDLLTALVACMRNQVSFVMPPIVDDAHSLTAGGRR